MVSTMSDKDSLIKYFLCGGVGGVCTVVTGHPMDTVKVRLQTMPQAKPGDLPLYTGTWDCYFKIIKTDGILGLYKGVTAPLASVTPIFAIDFLGYGCSKKFIKYIKNEKVLTKPDLFACGSFSGLCTTIVITPSERIKCLLQLQNARGVGLPLKYSGMIDCLRQLYAEGGVRSLYKGHVATMMRDGPAGGVYFMTYEWVREVVRHENTDMKIIITAGAGGCAGVANWLVAMPMDTLKTRFQIAPLGTYPNGIKDVLKQLLERDGPLALYRGIIPVMIRAFPANAACFLGFEMAVEFFDWVSTHK